MHMASPAIDKHQMNNQLNPKVLKDAAAKYKDHVKKIAKLYVEVGRAHEKEKDIFNALEGADIRYLVPRMRKSNIGYPSNEHAWIHFFLREAESQGYLKKSDYL